VFMVFMAFMAAVFMLSMMLPIMPGGLEGEGRVGAKVAGGLAEGRACI
jgi:hypothetical protein